MAHTSTSLEKNLRWGFLTLLGVGCLFVLLPFVSAILWAAILCFSTWPVYRRLLKALGNRQTLAACVMSLGAVIIILLPFVIVGVTLGDNIAELTSAARDWIKGDPRLPEWLSGIPVVGETLTQYWGDLMHGGSAVAWDKANGAMQPISKALLYVAVLLGTGVIQLTLSVFIAFFVYRDGVLIAKQLKTMVGRIGGQKAEHLLDVAGKTTRGVVHGVIGTALVQAIMAGVGFYIAGVPGAGVLSLVTFLFSVVPIGPPLIWAPASIWLLVQGQTGWGIFLFIWGIGVSSIDNVVKPWLISQGSQMPFLLIFFGVIGGVFAFGFIGVFLGPTLLAVGFRLFQEWAEMKPSELD